MSKGLKNFIGNTFPEGLKILSIAIVYSYLIYRLNPSLLFLNTTVCGGDTGSHNYIAYHLKEIFPSIHGWSHDWYFGFPFLYFYPPLLYVFAVLLGYVIPINVAFKLITVLGTMILPLSVYSSFNVLKLKEPAPTIGAILSLNFIFLEAYSIYGGNLPSTLSGEFSYSFSFSLFWILIALLKRGIEDKRFTLLNALILSLMVLSHPIPVAASILTVPILFFGPNAKWRMLYILRVYVLAFILTSFWSLPFLRYMQWQTTMNWGRFIRLSDIFPRSILPLEILGILGIPYVFFKRDGRVSSLSFATFINLLPYLLLNHSRVWNTRFLPFFTLGSILLGGYSLGTILSPLFRRKGFYLLLPLLAVANTIWIDSNLTYTPHWIRWNYEGFERKETWQEIKPLFDYLKKLPYGRVMWEYRPEYWRYGTPRVFEDIPLFAGKPTVEGLLIESAITSPFHFINQAETTKTPTRAVGGIKYPSFDMKRAVEHMRLCGIRYFIAYTYDVKKAADRFMARLATVGRFTVYEIPQATLITPLKDFRVEVKRRDWLKRSLRWYIKGDLSKPIIFLPRSLRRDVLTSGGKGLKKKEVKCVITAWRDDYIEFYTTGLGIPHMIKVSYFPRWHVEGGKGPYLVSPAFMVVVPESNLVSLRFK